MLLLRTGVTVSGMFFLVVKSICNSNAIFTEALNHFDCCPVILVMLLSSRLWT
jgi:hypothetical protein